MLTADAASGAHAEYTFTDLGIPPGGPKVALVSADFSADVADVRNKLLSTGLISQVDVISAGNDGVAAPLPTLAQLNQYNAVMVWSNYFLSNPTGLGDLLADYADGGGGVVINVFAFFPSPGTGIGGRIVSGGYIPFTLGSYTFGPNLTLVPDQPSHAILIGVSSFDGGALSMRHLLTPNAGSTLVAHWSDGTPLISTKQLTAGRIVGQNFFPGSSSVGGGYWQAGTDGARLMANSLIWASGGVSNSAPVAQSQSVTTNEDTAKAITLGATDVPNTHPPPYCQPP